MASQSAFKSKWFDESSETPIIAEQSRRLDSFLTAVADGRVDNREIQEQEARLVELMKEIEPQLDPTKTVKDIVELLRAAYPDVSLPLERDVCGMIRQLVDCDMLTLAQGDS